MAAVLLVEVAVLEAVFINLACQLPPETLTQLLSVLVGQEVQEVLVLLHQETIPFGTLVELRSLRLVGVMAVLTLAEVVVKLVETAAAVVVALPVTLLLLLAVVQLKDHFLGGLATVLLVALVLPVLARLMLVVAVVV